MGASASSSAAPPPGEALAASTGALPMLQKSFSSLADSQTNLIPVASLQEVFGLSSEKLGSLEENGVSGRLAKVLDNVGKAVVDNFFMVEKGGISWTEFLNGYMKCCGRVSASVSLGNLLKFFKLSNEKGGFSVELGFESDEEEQEVTMSGSLLASDVSVLFWMCWVMNFYAVDCDAWGVMTRVDLPDVSHLVLSAVVSCVEDPSSVDAWERDLSRLEVQLPADKLKSWFMSTVPHIASCFSKFVHAGFQNSIQSKEKAEPSSASVSDGSSSETFTLLTNGVAWAFSLSMRSTISEDFQKACFPIPGSDLDDILLYRSSIDGKGMNRFWSNVEGYNGPVLILISATSSDDIEDRRWIIGVHTQQGFENHDSFYGTSGCLYAVNPVFHALAASGKEKNFIYSHLHPSGKAYDPDPKPKPVGIAFGGGMGNERIFMDEDFAKITIRHYAVDKTYQHGYLIPNQGFLPVEAAVYTVEVWGLGPKSAKAQQNSHKKREELFTAQRRKIDLKTFSNWEDSPEKMMMDMMSNPNAVRREER